MKPQTENSSQVGQMSWNIQTWAASKIKVWVALGLRLKECKTFQLVQVLTENLVVFGRPGWVSLSVKCKIKPATQSQAQRNEKVLLKQRALEMHGFFSQLSFSSVPSPIPSMGCCGRRGTGRGSVAQLWGLCHAGLSPCWAGLWLSSCWAQRDRHSCSHSLAQQCTGQCQQRSCSKKLFCVHVRCLTWIGGERQFSPCPSFHPWTGTSTAC